MNDREVLSITNSNLILTLIRLGKAEMAKAGSDMICCSTISKPRLILSEICIGCSGHNCELGRWMLTLVSIIHSMVTIKGQVTNLTNLTDWPF